MSIPRSLQTDIDELRAQFREVEAERASDETVVVELQLRGVSARAIIDLPSYPDKPPYLFLEPGWHHPNVARDGRVNGLLCLNDWNRTFGLAVAVRELNQRLIEHPPTR